MFFNNKEKDLEIKKLKERIEELEAEKNSEDILINEINQVLKKFEKGFYGISVKSESKNDKLNEIKNNLNNALRSNSELADRSIQTLIEYGNANFEFPVNIENLSGKIGSIVIGIRALGSTVSELLALLDMTAEELNTDINRLTQSSTSLASSSNQQAASLEETAAALEEVTSTIINTNENTVKMANLSKEVNQSVKDGEILANDTFHSMESINSEVNLIEDATKIIDQIAFQTNILSLNAAVEAATAGEAGKGFAVVAQEVRNLATRSAQAAKEINDIVTNAKNRSNEGKSIAEKMINGYGVLNENISTQLSIIEEVSLASKEQREAIEQINDAVNELDQTTQQNATTAGEISRQSKHIENIANKLLEVVSKTTYIKDARDQVCDVDLMFELNKLKLDHINFKDTNYKKLDSKTVWKVKTDHECNLGKWMDEQERANEEFTKTSNWTKLKEVHHKVHNNVQMVIEDNANDNLNDMLTRTVDIDKAISDVFWSIQKTKRENCELSHNH